MKIIILVTGGRGGSDFFQGLLDGHKQILQIPSILRINKEFINIFYTTNNYEIASRFIKFLPHIFDSRKNKLERHNKLGKYKNKFYTVNKEKFIKYFKQLNSSQKKTRTKKKTEILINLYKAYFLARKKSIKEVKIIILHTHTVELTKKLFEFEKIDNCSIIHTMRHPHFAVCSPVFNWLRFKNGSSFFPKDLYFQYDLAINGLTDLCKINKSIYVVLLENLIKKRKKVMQDFCKIFKIKYSRKMLKCTYCDMQWWGDQISRRWISKKVKVNKLNKDLMKDEVFFKSDLKHLDYLTSSLIKKYFNKERQEDNKSLFPLKILPTKAEILVGKNTLKHRKIKHLISIPYFYLKRVFKLNSFFLSKTKLPYSIGSK